MRNVRLIPFVALVLAACSGQTTPATNVTASTATLNAGAACGANRSNCYWDWGYRAEQSGSWEYTPMAGPASNNADTQIPLGQSVQGLAPGTTYEVEFCGSLPSRSSKPPQSQLYCFDSRGNGPGNSTGVRIPGDISNSDPNATIFTTPYWQESFTGRFDQSFWNETPTNDPDARSFVDDPIGSGQVLQIFDCGVSAPALCNSGETWDTAGSTYGQRNSVYAGCDYSANPPTDRAYAAATPGDCAGTSNTGQPVDSWYRFGIYFPTGYQPSPGQNTLFQFHIDAYTPTVTYGGNAYSTSLEVATDWPGDINVFCPGTPNYCTQRGGNPRFELQVTGGQTSVVTQNSDPDVEHFTMPSNSLRTGHWYDVVLHIFWSADPNVGHVQWWVDGTKYAEYSGPTLYSRPGGSTSWNGIGVYDYRLWDAWDASIDFKNLIVGPNKASVGFSGS